jgi:hypothetical protein
MSRVSYYECDKCSQCLTTEQESDGAIALSSGCTVASLCLNCQKTTTVFESKEIARKTLDKARATLPSSRTGIMGY